jgi:hypothetical protein
VGHCSCESLLHRLRLTWGVGSMAGDKPSKFVGSNQWIGSMEIGFYLDNELGISWRNVFTNSGPEIAEKVRTVAMVVVMLMIMAVAVLYR